MSLYNTQVGVFDARTRFFELLERIEAGEEITLMRHGVAVARLVPPTAKSADVKSTTKERPAAVPMPSLSMTRGWPELALS
jgi:antitoxin (DNA-binding transcriptional repressor) of toxin-antitoxin stability system